MSERGDFNEAIGRVVAASYALACAQAEWDHRFAGQTIVETSSLSMPIADRINRARADLNAAIAAVRGSEEAP